MDPITQALVLASSLGALGVLFILFGVMKRFNSLLASHNELLHVMKMQLQLGENKTAASDASPEETEDTFIQPTMLFLNSDEMKQLENETLELDENEFERLEWLTSDDFEARFDDDPEDEDIDFDFENLPQPVKIKLYRFHNVLENLVENQEQFLSQKHPEAN